MSRLEMHRPGQDGFKTVAENSQEFDTPEVISDNPNIGALGSAAYQEDNLRVKGFCGELVDDPDTYMHYLHTKVLPVLADNPQATRVIDRAIVRRGLVIPTQELAVPLHQEVVVPLGGEWEGYDWVMTGTHMPGRILSESTQHGLRTAAEEADAMPYEAPHPLPPGYTMEKLSGRDVMIDDLESLAAIFRAAFKTYISPLSTAEDVRQWVTSENILPVVVRNEEGAIVAVANGDMGEISIAGQPFKFLEIGDSAANPNYHKMGLNRNIKHHIIGEAIDLGFHSIHTETRAAMKSPNYGNAKNGMRYRGTLYLNCKISGHEDVPETSDPDISAESRVMGSLNVWSMTQANPNWGRFTSQR